MRYIKAICTGVGFITHEDRENFTIQGFGEIWMTDDSQAAIDWSTRINGVEVTKEEADAIINLNTVEGKTAILP